ncbi:MAG TPA: hypothetical protein VEL05_11245 [Candidatus Acidoferrum sp.]|nr:hypothetical protein [Candidatus Acidoferrum sp.]
MGQTRVDLQHLLEDPRDAYPGGLEETILTEIVANVLDSGASRVSVRADRAEAVLVVVDDGAGCGGASWPATTTSRPARRSARRA